MPRSDSETKTAKNKQLANSGSPVWSGANGVLQGIKLPSRVENQKEPYDSQI